MYTTGVLVFTPGKGVSDGMLVYNEVGVVIGETRVLVAVPVTVPVNRGVTVNFNAVKAAVGPGVVVDGLLPK